MNDYVDDFALNKRLAEIAGQLVRQDVDNHGDPVLLFFGRAEWSPLHNWSQLGPLMEQFMVELEWGHLDEDNNDAWRAICGDTMRGDLYRTSPDMRRAIALAIIAAHEEGE